MSPREDAARRAIDPTATMLIEPAARPSSRSLVEERFITVEVMGGPMDGTQTTVSGDELRIGRGKDNHLPLTLDPMVSTNHARIRREGGHFWLEDLHSRNGTFFGDRRLEERALITPGATFVMGRTPLEFLPA